MYESLVQRDHKAAVTSKLLFFFFLHFCLDCRLPLEHEEQMQEGAE